MRKYVPGSGDLPTASWLRREYVPKCGEEMKANIRDNLSGKPVILLCDETTDSNGNCVFAVLIETLEGTSSQQLYLGSCSFLEKANATTTSQAIMQTLSDLQIDFCNVRAICTDSAPYMLKCVSTLKVLIGDHLQGFTCWCHKLNLLGEIWQKNLKELNHVICCLKNIFRNGRKIRACYKTFIVENHTNLTPKLFPIPVMTRWSSWFSSVEYFFEYFHVLVEFFNQYEALPPQGQHLVEEYLCNPDMTKTLEIQAAFVAENCWLLTKPIFEFQTRKKPVAHLLMSRISFLQNKCKLVQCGQFDAKVTNLIEELPSQNRASTENILKNCANLTLKKLDTLLLKDEANIEIFVALDYIFEPSKLFSKVGLNNFEKLKKMFTKLPEFMASNSKCDLLLCYTELCDVVHSECANDTEINVIDVLMGLKAKSSTFREFCEKCMKSLWLPVSNADSESFFSTYNLILTDKRRRMKEENIVTCGML